MNASVPFRWNLRGREMLLAEDTRIMGVVNLTPDSFSDGGQHPDPATGYAHACRLLEEGADLLDIGGESTRPGAVPVTPDLEIQRILPVIKRLAREHPEIPLSVDTSKAAVARAALDAGAHIINDVTAGRGDPAMLPLAAETGAGLVLMHMQGTPRDMQANPQYQNLLEEILHFFRERLHTATEAGVSPHQIVLDPGIGFGKTLDHNLSLIANLPRLSDLAHPLLLGVSRKRWLGDLTGRPVHDRLPASLGGLAACIDRGAKIMRVHDVLSSCDVARILDRIKRKTT